MTTFAENIAFVLGLFEDRTPSKEECDELAALLGSREEFVAYLLLRRPAFKGPLVMASLAKLQVYAPAISAAISDRETFGQEALQKSRQDLAGTIARSIEQDAAAKPVMNAVATVLRDIAAAKPDPLTRISDPYAF